MKSLKIQKKAVRKTGTLFILFSCLFLNACHFGENVSSYSGYLGKKVGEQSSPDVIGEGGRGTGSHINNDNRREGKEPTIRSRGDREAGKPSPTPASPNPQPAAQSTSPSQSVGPWIDYFEKIYAALTVSYDKMSKRPGGVVYQNENVRGNLAIGIGIIDLASAYLDYSITKDTMISLGKAQIEFFENSRPGNYTITYEVSPDGGVRIINRSVSNSILDPKKLYIEQKVEVMPKMDDWQKSNMKKDEYFKKLWDSLTPEEREKYKNNVTRFSNKLGRRIESIRAHPPVIIL